MDRRGSAETAELGHVGLEGRDGQPEYYIPQGNPNPYAALRGAEQGPGFKNHFKHAYMTGMSPITSLSLIPQNGIGYTAAEYSGPA